MPKKRGKQAPALRLTTSLRRCAIFAGFALFIGLAAFESFELRVPADNQPRSSHQLALNRADSTPQVAARSSNGDDPGVGEQAHASRIQVLSVSSVAQNPAYWLGVARQGDASAAVVIYQVFRHCQQQRHHSGAARAGSEPQPLALPECAGFPSDFDFLTLLEPAASAGNAAARFQFATEVLRSNLTATGDEGKSTQPLAQRAIGFLEDEGSRGSVLALLELARAYESGAAVEQDLERAYAYLLTIQSVSQHPMHDVARASIHLRKSLSLVQHQAAVERSRRLVEMHKSARSGSSKDRAVDHEGSAVPPV